jgi:hypothetical protein
VGDLGKSHLLQRKIDSEVRSGDLPWIETDQGQDLMGHWP